MVDRLDRIVCHELGMQKSMCAHTRCNEKARLDGVVRMVDRAKTNHLARATMLSRNLELCTRPSWNFYTDRGG